MPVRLIGSTRHYTGLSTDTKPTDALAGSSFFETDTGASWVFDGATWRTDISSDEVLVNKIEELTHEVELLRAGLVLTGLAEEV